MTILEDFKDGDKMAEEIIKGRKPDYSCSGIDIWLNKGEKYGDYLTIQFFGKKELKINVSKRKDNA